MKNHVNQMIGGVFLVSGTTIGAGILAFPVSTGMAGFFPSIFLFFVYWLYMMYTAFLLLEVNLWSGEGSNLTTMAHDTLGRVGEVISWVIYLLLLYMLTTAYIAASAPVFVGLAESFLSVDLPDWLGAFPLLLIFGFFVYQGTRSVDYVNRLLFAGLGACFLSLIFFVTPHVENQLLYHVDWRYLLLGSSVVATAFGFHIIIPSLTTYMEGDLPRLKQAILIGSIIPFIVYIMWNYLTLGVLPIEGESGIREGYALGHNSAILLGNTLGNRTITLVARFFSFFAVVTSFLGVSLSLIDFLADGFHIKKETHRGKLLLFGLTFLPPLVFSIVFPRAFLSALEYAGAFGVVTLLGLLPAAMVWWGRYRRNFAFGYRVWGGKPMLILTILLSILSIGLEIVHKCGVLKI